MSIAFLAVLAFTIAGCGSDEAGDDGTNGGDTSTKSTTAPQSGGIALDPNLKSKTGVPTDEDIKALIDLQAQVPYPVMVPTEVPGGYQLDATLTGVSGPTPRDPIGYYSYRYGDPSDPYKTLTFNQSRSNAKPLSAYYITKVNIGGTEFNVYWHISRDYLPQGDPVPMDDVGDAETFVVVWRGQFTDAAGTPQEVWYQMNTGTNTGLGWADVEAVLSSIKPLSEVAK